MDNFYNTIIIGAGPAGLIAGKYLKNALILEQRDKIGRPVQCVGMSIWSFKNQGMNPDSKGIKSVIYKVERVMPNGRRIGKLKKDPIGYVVERESFEQELSKKTQAKLILCTKVLNLKKINDFWQITINTGKLFWAKYIIAADGFNSIVRRNIFPDLKNAFEFSSGIEYSVEFSKPIDTRCIKFYFNNETYKNGYGWFFPTSNNTANVGVGGSGETPTSLLEELLRGKITKEYGNYNVIKTMVGTTGSVIKSFPLFKDNIFLVGDAAGLNDPIFRAGTNQAMVSAKIASQCILNDEPKKYTHIINSLPLANLKIKKAADIFYEFSNELLNELGNVLENRGFSDIKNPIILARLLKQRNFRKNIFKILYFLKVWQKSKDWLW